MHCTYSYKGQDDLSYAELSDIIYDEIKDNPAKLDDTIFSQGTKQFPRRDIQYENIKKLNQEYIISKSSSTQPECTTSINGEPSTKGTMHVLDFFDSNMYVRQDGSHILTQFNDEEWEQELIKHYKNNDTTKDQAEQLAKLDVENGKAIKRDAPQLHPLFTTSYIWNKSKRIDEFYDDVKDKLPDSLKDQEKAVTNLLIGLRQVYLTEKSRKVGSNSRTIFNTNITAKLKDIDKELFAHIDWMFIDDSGTLHIYLLKTCTTPESKWPIVKKQKYKHQLAMIKRMLANNGIRVSGATLNIVPILLKYNIDESDPNNSFKYIEDIEVKNAERYSSREGRAGYSMEYYDNIAASFIDDNSTPFPISNKPIETAMQNCQLIFQNLNIKEDGIHKSAKEWIAHAPDRGIIGNEPIIIRESNESGYKYELIIRGKVHKIKSKRVKEKNDEILSLVQKEIDKLDDEKGYTVNIIKEAIKDAFEKGWSTLSSHKEIDSYLNESILSVMHKYMPKKVNDEWEYEWELEENLIDAGIIIFKNKAGVRDIITLSAFNLNVTPDYLKNTSTNILGNYKTDYEYIDMAGDFGNIEAIRTMELLNEVLPQLGDNAKFGDIKIISSISNGGIRYFDASSLAKHFAEVVRVVNSENADANIINNFRQKHFVDPYDSIIEEYLAIIEDKPEMKMRYEKFDFDEVIEAKSTEDKIAALYNVQQKMLNMYPNLANFNDTIDKDPYFRNMFKLYSLITEAYLQLKGERPIYRTSYNNIDGTFMTSNTVDDPNIRIVTNNMAITYDTIAREVVEQFAPIEKEVNEFYKSKGYTDTQNLIIGNQLSAYKNLYEVDENGNKTFNFKNPYDYSNDLTPDERAFLKKVLLHLANIKHKGHFKYTDVNDPKLKEYVKAHPSYLFVPLIRASKTTANASVKNKLAKMKNTFKKIIKVSSSYEEFQNELLDEEREGYTGNEENIYRLSLRSKFSASIPDANDSNINRVLYRRNDMIKKYGEGFFETNVNNILAEMLVDKVSVEQCNKFIVGTKALLLQMRLTGRYAGNEEILNKEIDYIEKYLKVNVFKKSIMSKQEQALVGVITPIKRTVTNMLLGGNIRSAIRDTLEGLQQNFIRSAIKFNTNISAKNLSKAYKYVFTHSRTNAMNINLLSKLCLVYRISNTDVGRITERLKTDRNGILAIDNIMYSTLRGPDFLNRMTLFVAKCMEDGVWDSFSINDDTGELIYDWTKDKRFNAYAKGDKSDLKLYKHQRALYLSKLKEWNESHPNKKVTEGDALPSPYSDQEIQTIRAVGDNIFGAYDKSKKGIYEYHSYGFLLGMFSTYMNGMMNNYFMKPQKNNVTMLKQIQATNSAGELLFWDNQGFNMLTLEEGGDPDQPIYINEPIIVYGIFPTLNFARKILLQDNKLAAWKYLTSNDIAKKNMRKFISDILGFLLFSVLLKNILDDSYKDVKKAMPENSFITNASLELIYNGAGASFDAYKGPINIFEYFSKNQSIPYLSVPQGLVSDGFGVLFGNKNVVKYALNTVGLTRSFKDSGYAIYKAMQEN